MLQAVHTEKGSPRASSLYCRWICVENAEGSRLVAIWMDSEMRAFESEFHFAGQTEESGEEIVLRTQSFDHEQRVKVLHSAETKAQRGGA